MFQHALSRNTSIIEVYRVRGQPIWQLPACCSSPDWLRIPRVCLQQSPPFLLLSFLLFFFFSFFFLLLRDCFVNKHYAVIISWAFNHRFSVFRLLILICSLFALCQYNDAKSREMAATWLFPTWFFFMRWKENVFWCLSYLAVIVRHGGCFPDVVTKCHSLSLQVLLSAPGANLKPSKSTATFG